MGKKSRKKFKSKEKIKRVIEENKAKKEISKTSFNYSKYVPYIVIAIFVVGGIFLIRYVNTMPGKYDEFAKCIVDSGAKMYSAWWCTHCTEQKKLFGNSFKIIEKGGAHIECSPGGIQTFSQFCLDAGIKGTPTWKDAQGSVLGNRMPLEELAIKTGCPL